MRRAGAWLSPFGLSGRSTTIRWCYTASAITSRNEGTGGRPFTSAASTPQAGVDRHGSPSRPALSRAGVLVLQATNHHLGAIPGTAYGVDFLAHDSPSTAAPGVSRGAAPPHAPCPRSGVSLRTSLHMTWHDTHSRQRTPHQHDRTTFNKHFRHDDKPGAWTHASGSAGSLATRLCELAPTPSIPQTTTTSTAIRLLQLCNPATRATLSNTTRHRSRNGVSPFRLMVAPSTTSRWLYLQPRSTDPDGYPALPRHFAPARRWCRALR